MRENVRFVALIASIVALGGLLMGFDASVISGVIKFIEIEFQLTKLELGWAVSSLTLTSTAAMMAAGPISDRIGRRRTLKIASLFFLVSAALSAIAPNFIFLVVARMLGGFGVGAALIIAPVYIAEIAPSRLRGTLVSFNQLNIVVGISLAFFTNYLIHNAANSEAPWVDYLGINKYNWRWMLGLETIPALIYFLALFLVPMSPRWLIMKGKEEAALKIMSRVNKDLNTCKKQIEEVKKSLLLDKNEAKPGLSYLFQKKLSLVLSIGIVIGILQQITGINSVFFYAPMIFEQTGIGTDASFIQAILVGLTNVIMTIIAMILIDKVGRKPLLIFGVAGIAISMFLMAYGFYDTEYKIKNLPYADVSSEINEKLLTLEGTAFKNDIEFKAALSNTLGNQLALKHESTLIKNAIETKPMLILVGVLMFVAFFALSLGPVMWVLFSEIFPNNIRGIAISFVGVINSAVSFIVQLIFPWELSVLGTASTFLIYGLFATAGLIFILKVVPETKGKSLEEIERVLVNNQ